MDSKILENLSLPLQIKKEDSLIQNEKKNIGSVFLENEVIENELLSATEVFQKKDKLAHSPNSVFRMPNPISQKENQIPINTKQFPIVTETFKPKIFQEKESPKDLEMLKLTQEINLFRERYLFKLAEIAELEGKIKELTDINATRRDFIGENTEKKHKAQNFQGLEIIGADVLSQDVGISPIRSLTLTEKSAIDRIDSLTRELDDTKKKLKSFKDQEEIFKLKLPEDEISHLSYYELVTGL